jgi:uncharacterized protein YceK
MKRLVLCLGMLFLLAGCGCVPNLSDGAPGPAWVCQ